MRNRNIKINIFLNEKEKKIFDEKVKKSGLNKSEFFRRFILDYELKEQPDERFYEMLSQLRGMANNLNQMAKYISKGNYDELERNYKQVVEYFKSLPAFVEKFKNSRSYKVSAPAREELKRYKTSIEKLAKDAENLNTKIIAFTKEFEVEYKEFKEKTIKLGVISTFRGMAKFVALFVPFVSVINSIFDSFMADFKMLCKSTRFTGIQK